MRGLYRVDKASGAIRRYGQGSGSLSSDNLYCLFADPLDENLLWQALSAAVFAVSTNEAGVASSLRNKMACLITWYTQLSPTARAMWVATNQGLCQINRKSLRTRTYTREDGLMADEFNRFHALALPDGRIFLGGMEGITAFDSKQPNEDRYRPPVYVTGISINNAPLEPRLSAGELPVAGMQGLDLAHWQNFVTIEFAAMQYNRSDKIRYRYQLEGVDERWIETETPVTKYTDSGPGTMCSG